MSVFLNELLATIFWSIVVVSSFVIIYHLITNQKQTKPSFDIKEKPFDVPKITFKDIIEKESDSIQKIEQDIKEVESAIKELESVKLRLKEYLNKVKQK